jgi:tetratricopeptide (TPR) repeat protein
MNTPPEFIFRAPGRSLHLTAIPNPRHKEYLCMKRVPFFCVLLVVMAITSGCIAGTGNPAVSPGRPDSPAPGTAMTSGGGVIAISVNADAISTSSPEAKVLFIQGITASTQYARYNESLANFDQALSIDPGFTAAWYAKGVALHNMNRYDEAVMCYDRALVLDPQNSAVWSLKGKALDGSGRHTEAAGCYKKATGLDSRYSPSQTLSI